MASATTPSRPPLSAGSATTAPRTRARAPPSTPPVGPPSRPPPWCLDDLPTGTTRPGTGSAPACKDWGGGDNNVPDATSSLQHQEGDPVEYTVEDMRQIRALLAGDDFPSAPPSTPPAPPPSTPPFAAVDAPGAAGPHHEAERVPGHEDCA